MNRPISKRLRRQAPTLLMLLTVMAMTWSLFEARRYNLNNQLKTATSQFQRTIDHRLASHLERLASLRDLFAGTEFISRESFHRFASRLIERDPAILALEWIPQVPDADRERFRHLAQASGLPDYQMKRFIPNRGWVAQSAAWAGHYYPVYYVEPLPVNRNALGIDLGSHRERRRAIESAIVSPSPVATPPIELAQGGHGILFFQAINPDPADAPESQKGLVLMVIRFEEFFAELYRNNPELAAIDFKLTDPANDDFELHARRSSDSAALPWISKNWRLLNQSLTVQATGNQGFQNSVRFPWLWFWLPLGLLAIYFSHRGVRERSDLQRHIESEIATRQKSLLEAYESLQLVSARHEAIVASMADAVVVIDQQGLVQQVNSQVEALFGLSRDALIGQNVKRLMPPNVASVHDDYLTTYQRTRIPHIIGHPRELFGRHSDGNLIPILLTVTEFETDSGKYYVGILSDLREQHRRRDERQAVQSRFDQILASTDEGILQIDPTGKIAFANASACQLLERDLDYLLGQTYASIFDPADIEANEKLRNSLDPSLDPEQRALHDVRLHMITAAGNSLPVSLNVSTLKSADDRTTGLVLVFSDIQQQILDEARLMQQHREIEQANDQLRQVNQSMEQFAYIASHDLRAPLRSIRNLADWIHEDLGDNLDEAIQSNFDMMQNRIGRMDTLLVDLLEYSRIRKITESLTRFDSGQAIEQVLELFELPPNAKVELEGSFEEIVSSRTGFELVIRNLVSNALKHAGETEPVVIIDANRDTHWHRFRVTDNGPGISSENAEVVFEVFTKLASRDQVEGSGLGLSICRRAIEHLAGNIYLDTGYDQGARFVVELPREGQTESEN